MARIPVDLGPKRTGVDVLAAHGGGDDLRERRGERGDRADGAADPGGRDQALEADEDVEALDQVALSSSQVRSETFSPARLVTCSRRRRTRSGGTA